MLFSVLTRRHIAADNPELVIDAQVIIEAGDIRLVSAHGVGDSFAAAGAERFVLFAGVCLSYQTSAFETPDFHNSAILSLSGFFSIRSSVLNIFPFVAVSA